MRLALLMTLVVGCTVDHHVEVRACNDTGFDVMNLEFRGETFDVLANDACTPYEGTDRAGSQPRIRLFIGDDSYVNDPIDQTTFLTDGRWSYHLTVQFGGISVRVNPIED